VLHGVPRSFEDLKDGPVRAGRQDRARDNSSFSPGGWPMYKKANAVGIAEQKPKEGRR
jgi:hypothetical protein